MGKLRDRFSTSGRAAGLGVALVCSALGCAQAAPRTGAQEAAGTQVPPTPRGEAPAVTGEVAPEPGEGRVAEKEPAPIGFDAWGIGLADSDTGVRVSRVDVRSPAAPLLHPGDIVLDVDERPVKRARDLDHYLGELPRGEGVLLRVRRGGRTEYLGVQAGTPPARPAPKVIVVERSTPAPVASAEPQNPRPPARAPAAPYGQPPYGAIPFGYGGAVVPYGSYGYFVAPEGSEWGSVPPGYYREAQPGNPLAPWPPSARIPPEPPPR